MCWCRRPCGDPASPGNRVQDFWRPDTSARSWASTNIGPSRAVSRANRRHRLRAAGYSARGAAVRRQLEAGRAEVENQYARSVPPRGQPDGLAAVHRGLRDRSQEVARHRRIPASGLAGQKKYCAFDADRRFGVEGIVGRGAGRVHRRAKCCKAIASRTIVRPSAFGCTPERPLGDPMVSAEGTCTRITAIGDIKRD